MSTNYLTLLCAGLTVAVALIAQHHVEVLREAKREYRYALGLGTTLLGLCGWLGASGVLAWYDALAVWAVGCAAGVPVAYLTRLERQIDERERRRTIDGLLARNRELAASVNAIRAACTTRYSRFSDLVEQMLFIVAEARAASTDLAIFAGQVQGIVNHFAAMAEGES